MARLLVLNGPPAVGKSTLAARYVEDHPLALRLDIDDLRDALGRWRDDPDTAGRRARALASAMARDHLRAGYDVVVAQLYGRAEHPDELRAIAAELDASYREVVLLADLGTTLDRFVRRGGDRLADALDRPEGLDGIAELHARVDALRADRPWTIGVTSIADDPRATYDALVAAIDAVQ
jgi:predicted kinase